MRLWSLHPRYLDAKGLTALWREGLLVQAVLLGKTRGYQSHPQLARFRLARDPVASIGAYLSTVYSEAAGRGYNYNYNKIVKPRSRARLRTTSGQLVYERSHLLKKLKERDPRYYRQLLPHRQIAANPVFKIVPGQVEPWEKIREIPKPVVVVSKCLGFAACRYDGTMVPCPAVKRLRPFVRFKPVCPETAIGLGVPRSPIRIVESGGRRRLVQPATGRDLTSAINRFASKYLSSLKGVDGFILKSRSPSCGIKGVKSYRDGTSKSKPISRQGAGLFASAALRRFPGLAVIDENRMVKPYSYARFLAAIKARAGRF